MKKFSFLLLISIGATSVSFGQLEPAEKPSTLTKRESISGIGTNHTVYTTTLTMDPRCQDRIAILLKSDARISAYKVDAHTVDILWTEDTQENIIFFFEKLEFQYLFPCAR